jgi:hypothetical protein
MTHTEAFDDIRNFDSLAQNDMSAVLREIAQIFAV